MPPVFVLACDLHMDLLLNVMTLDTSGVTLYFVCVNKCQKNSLPSTWLLAPFVWFDLFSQTELKASGATVKILKGVRGRDVKCLIMEPDNMIHRLQTATSPETIKPWRQKRAQRFPTYQKWHLYKQGPWQSVHIQTHRVGGAMKKDSWISFFFSPSDMVENSPPTADDILLLISSVIVIAHIQKDKHIKGELSKFLSPAMFPSAFFCAHFKSIASERFVRKAQIQKKMILFFF